MKLLLLIVVVGFVQICFSAVIVKRDATTSQLTNEDIDKMRTELKGIEGVDPQAVDNFTNIFYGLRENSTEDDIFESVKKLLSLAVNADISKFNRTAFETIFNDSEEEEEVVTNSITERNTNSAENSSEEGLTADDLKKIENILEKELSESQTKDTMKFLEGFRKDANSNEYISAFSDLFISAARNALGLKQKNKIFENVDNENTQ